jgi:hypothetical protein
VLVDGPYGGIEQKLELTFDSLVLVAGGGGITVCLPRFEYVAGVVLSSRAINIPHVKLVCAVRKQLHMEWILSELEALEKSLPAYMLEISVHVTRDGPMEHASSPDMEPSPFLVLTIESCSPAYLWLGSESSSTRVARAWTKSLLLLDRDGRYISVSWDPHLNFRLPSICCE